MPKFTLLEYDTITEAGEAVEPATVRRENLVFGTPYQLSTSTIYFRLASDVDAKVRVSTDGAAPTLGDRTVWAQIGTGGPVRYGTGPFVHVTL